MNRLYMSSKMAVGGEDLLYCCVSRTEKISGNHSTTPLILKVEIIFYEICDALEQLKLNGLFDRAEIPIYKICYRNITKVIIQEKC